MSEFLRWRNIAAVAAASGSFALALAGCGGKGTAETITVVRTVTEPVATNPAVTTTPEARLTVVFDDLGARDPTIFVYPCVRDTDTCRQPNGEYPDGYTLPADCKIEGRDVTSVEPEPYRHSNDWIRLLTSNGLRQYATAVYVEKPEELLRKLEDC